MMEPTRKGALLDLVIMKNKELVTDMKVQESIGYSNCERMGGQDPKGRKQGEKELEHCISGKQTLSSSELCLEESHGL